MLNLLDFFILYSTTSNTDLIVIFKVQMIT